MSEPPNGGQMHKWKNKIHILPKNAKANPPINRTRYKRLSLGDVQTCNGIFERTRKPKKVTPITLFY